MLGGLLGGAMGAAGAIGSAAMAAREAKKNRDFQKMMSNTSYQRGMKDMRKAGLNPILAYQKGGASTPAGSAALVPNIGATAAQGVTAGISTSKAQAEIANIKANTRLTNYKADLTKPKASVAGEVGDIVEGGIASAKDMLKSDDPLGALFASFRGMTSGQKAQLQDSAQILAEAGETEAEIARALKDEARILGIERRPLPRSAVEVKNTKQRRRAIGPAMKGYRRDAGRISRRKRY